MDKIKRTCIRLLPSMCANYRFGVSFSDKDGDAVCSGDYVVFQREGNIFPSCGTISRLDGEFYIRCYDVLFDKYLSLLVAR